MSVLQKCLFPFVNNKYSEVIVWDYMRIQLLTFHPVVLHYRRCLSKSVITLMVAELWFSNFITPFIVISWHACLKESPLYPPVFSIVWTWGFFSSSTTYSTIIIFFGPQRVPDFSSGSPLFYILWHVPLRLWSLGLLSGMSCSRLMLYLTCFQIWYQRSLQGALILFSGGIDFRKHSGEQVCSLFLSSLWCTEL